MKKGFTLIELLAVIVILALIAVIAVPVVINIIENAKTSARLRSIDNYIHAVELEISQNILKGNKLSDGYHNIEMFDVEVKGEIPDYGYIEIKDGKIVNYHVSIDNKPYSDAKVELGKNEDNKKTDETKIDPMKAVSELSIDWINQEIIKGISFSYKDALALNFYIDKRKIKDKNVYLKVKNITKYGVEGEIIEEIKEYKTTTKYVIFSYNNIKFQEFTNNTLFELVEEDGKVIDSIYYDISTYAKNIVYKKASGYEKEILTSLINLGTSLQIQFSYKNDNLAYDVLKEEDKNISALTDKGLQFYNDISKLNVDIENNTNQVFTDIGVTVMNPSISFDTPITASIRFKKSINFTEDELSKYGYILFHQDAYTKLKEKGIENFNINSEEIYDIVDKKNDKTEAIVYKKFAYFNYKFYLKNLADIIYAIPYYIDDDGNYKYGSLVKFSPVFYIDKVSEGDMRNVVYSMFNLAATIR